jgi:hypothetical protein
MILSIDRGRSKAPSRRMPSASVNPRLAAFVEDLHTAMESLDQFAAGLDPNAGEDEYGWNWQQSLALDIDDLTTVLDAIAGNPALRRPLGVGGTSTLGGIPAGFSTDEDAAHAITSRYMAELAGRASQLASDEGLSAAAHRCLSGIVALLDRQANLFVNESSQAGYEAACIALEPQFERLEAA